MNDKTIFWGWKLATDPDDVMHFMNGSGIYQHPVTDVKISAVNKTSHREFYVFYQRDSSSQPLNGWGWKLATDTDDVWNFLNGKGSYKQAVADARICGFGQGSHTEFYIFYRSGKTGVPNSWGWKLATDITDAKHFLNGDGTYDRPVVRAEIVTVKTGGGIQYYILYQQGSSGQPPGTWDVGDATTPDAVMKMLNRQGDYPSPLHDAKIVSSYQDGSVTEFMVFYPPVFLIITRPLFINSLPEYIGWKHAKGFEVCLVTAEWINANVPGADIRLKIRNCVRHYVKTAVLKFALLIGDSIDVTTDPAKEPPPPSLSEPWNLPAGYYQWDNIGIQYSSLYYSDLTDKIHYTGNETFWTGTYAVYIGILPVRGPVDLVNILTKTMTATTTKELSHICSGDLYTGDQPKWLPALKNIAGPAILMSEFVFDKNAPASDIYNALFGRKGVIIERGHGNLGLFIIGSTTITNVDAKKFQFINLLYITGSCIVQAYHLGECLDEAFLKTKNGPAVIMTETPWGSKTQYQSFSSQEEGFWTDLFAGKSIGQAFYDHCNGAWQNPLHLFGDPSQVIFRKT
jgi:hypothetical protein